MLFKCRILFRYVEQSGRLTDLKVNYPSKPAKLAEIIVDRIHLLTIRLPTIKFIVFNSNLSV
jgi:hypothetical protein